MEVLYARGHDPATALTLLARLRAGEVVAIQIDRPPASATTVDATLLGVRCRVPEGPFRLAQASGAPIVPVFVRRAGYRRYALEIEPAFHVARSAERAVIDRAAQRAIDALERFVRAHPDQWFHFVHG
jgi:KDO2-lipid IV(A) lauroyltransferase